MSRLVASLLRLYGRLLRIYPTDFWLEYGEELLEVFEMAVQDAISGGRLAVLRRGWMELRDLPGVVIRGYFQRKRFMNPHIHEPKTISKPTPWRAVILSLAPFLILGPLNTILGYLPRRTTTVWVIWSPLITTFDVVLILFGLGLGLHYKFPRWSYPYFMLGVIAISGGVMYLLTHTPLHNSQLLVIPLVMGIFILLTWRMTFFKTFYQQIRQDWTYLSYAMYIAVILISSGTDHDESPYLTVPVLIPSILTITGALIYLRCVTIRQRASVLVASLTVALVVWILPVLDGMTSSVGAIFAVITLFSTLWLFLAALLVAPALVTLLPKPGPDPSKPIV